MLIEVKIGALIMDPNSNSPIVVLKGVDTDTVLPIWVGAFEANAIALALRSDSAIFAEQKVLDISSSTAQSAPEPDFDSEAPSTPEDWPDLIG